MGSIHSYLSSELTLAAIIASGLLAFGYVQYTKQPPEPSLTKPVQEVGGPKRSKKRKQVQGESAEETLPKPPVVSSPAVVPGGFTMDPVSVDTDAAPPKPKKSKKKKGKKAAGAGDTLTPGGNQSDGSSATGESSRQHSSRKRQSFGAEQDEAWTRVEPRRRQKPLAATLDIDEGKPTAELTSDAGVTTSVTGNSSPVTERTEDEGPTPAPENRRTLAEKILPKPRKTGVDDMLETSDYPGVSRVMRVQPRADEKPAPGFSWADYEDVHVAAEDADGEDDGGWGVVKSRGRSRPDHPQQQQPEQSSSTTETKRQRQNAAKREAQKTAKADAETERLATLARHKRELEKARIEEQYAQKPGKKSPSGGATASVDDRGHLVWD